MAGPIAARRESKPAGGRARCNTRSGRGDVHLPPSLGQEASTEGESMSLRNGRGRRSIIAGATMVLLCLAGVTRADAATPAAGTVSPTGPTVHWTAGPFAVANPSAQSGTLL